MNQSKNELSSVCLKFSPKKWEGKIPHEILIEALEEIHPRAKIKKYTKNEVLEKFIGIFVVEDKNKIWLKKKNIWSDIPWILKKKKQKQKTAIRASESKYFYMACCMIFFNLLKL